MYMHTKGPLVGSVTEERTSHTAPLAPGIHTVRVKLVKSNALHTVVTGMLGAFVQNQKEDVHVFVPSA